MSTATVGGEPKVGPIIRERDPLNLVCPPDQLDGIRILNEALSGYWQISDYWYPGLDENSKRTHQRFGTYVIHHTLAIEVVAR